MINCFSGQQIAAQMQAANPDLVNQLRTAMTGQNDGQPGQEGGDEPQNQGQDNNK